MKTFKIIKSMNYVSYPIYQELVKIGGSVSSFKNVLIAAFVGMLVDKTPLSSFILEAILCMTKKENLIDCEPKIMENSKIAISIIIALLIFALSQLFHYLSERLGSNKNTRKKQEKIAYEFYNVVIPILIEVKGLVEQAQESEKDGKNNNNIKLYLLQALFNMHELDKIVTNMDIKVKKITGKDDKDSRAVLEQINENAYRTFCYETSCVINTLSNEIHKNFVCCSEKSVINEVDMLRKLPNDLLKKISTKTSRTPTV